MNKELTNKILEGYSKQYPSLIDFSACSLAPKFESELQRKEYEQVLRDVHCCDDRRSLIHSKKGVEIVILYMKVWQIGVQQAMRELITDEAYTLSIAYGYHKPRRVKVEEPTSLEDNYEVVPL